MNRVMLDAITNPWFDRFYPVALSLMVVGIFLIWVHRRLAPARLWGLMGTCLGANGVFLLLCFRDPYPSELTMLTETALGYLTLIYLTAILVCFLLVRLPLYGVDDTYLIDQDRHVLRPYVVPVTFVVVLLAFWFVLTGPFVLIDRTLGDTLPYVMMVCTFGLVIVCAHTLIPFEQIRETALLGEVAPPRELQDIFAATGPAAKTERIAVPVVFMAVWAVIVFVSGGIDRAGTDWFGICMLIALAASVAAVEIGRAKRKGSGLPTAQNAPARQSLW